ncbi:MAG: type VI secretion system contractile sheath large subunit [Gemmatimonadetes bacterium]|nr:type VI secretion system contractile sheath large subunit [Gemmatimonadota bacterium]
MAEAKQKQAAAPAEAEVTEGSLLDQIVEEGRFGKETEAQQRGREMIKLFVKDVLEGAVTFSADTEAMLNHQIAEIDRLVSEQLNEILHHEKFQKLEATWTGLRYLIANTETGPMLKVRVLPITKKELLRDVTAGRAAMGVDRSELFRKIYQEEYNVFGGNPYGALLGDFEFGKSGQDIKLLDAMSKIAATAHAPFITGTSPDMFGFESFTELTNMYQLSSVFEGSEYAQWRSFRESEDARYVALTAPRMLLREPFGTQNPIEEFDFEEDVSGKEHHKYLWGNAAWGLGARVTSAFAQHGWCARIRGVTSGGKLEGLPVHNFETDSGDIAMKCPTETVIPDDHEMEMAKLGFAPLANEKNTANAVFFSVQSAQKPKEYVGTGGDAATANAAISAQLPYIFAVSRFAHYLKVMMRDYIGSYKTKGELQKMLQNWIGEYVLKSENAPEDAKAKKPLSDARIDVIENPRAPGQYQAVAYLRPHFQLDAVDFSLRLVADVPEA